MRSLKIGKKGRKIKVKFATEDSVDGHMVWVLAPKTRSLSKPYAGLSLSSIPV